ncbi:tyrosine-type recombinase/integrase [Bradyrhizobium sp. Pha-3]|uniref:tyrosine-type recombinase/integrase n=1 Tax=Bradyrhizobium sp. Pha-3 TaxID=208375 RepID=UPI0035D52945
MASKSPAKTKNLLDRNGRYWARLAVPAALRPIIGKRELLEALGPDLTVAKRKLPGAIGRMQDQLNAAREERAAVSQPLARPPREGRILSPGNLAKAHFSSELALDDAERSVDPAVIGIRLDEHARLFQPAYEVTLRNVASGRFSNEEAAAAVGWAIDGFRERGNTDVVDGSPAWRELARTLAGVQLETLKARAARDNGDFTYVPGHPALAKSAPTASDPLAARILGPDSERTLGDLAEQFATEKATGDRTRHDNRVTIRMFEEQIGELLPIYRLTRQHVHGFKRALAEAPANYTKRFPGMTFPDAIKANKARAKPYPLLDARTVNDKYLARLHAFLNWAVRGDIIPDNPAAGIKADAVQASEPPRVNFTPDDLGRLFGEHFAPDGKWGQREWAMVISLFSGLRASELAQVKLNSVRTERGVLVIAVEEQTKNIGSQRLVPVHSTLLALGFEKYVAGLRKRKETHLFPVWYREGMDAKAKAPKDTATIDHYFPRYLPRRFNVTYLKKVGIVDGRKTWHSFRHTFKSGLKMAGVPKDMRDQLAGHSDKSAGAGYEHGQPVEAMKDAIERLMFDGLGL